MKNPFSAVVTIVDADEVADMVLNDLLSGSAINTATDNKSGQMRFDFGDNENKRATEEDAAARVQQLMDEGMSRKDAVKQTAKELNLPKNVVYDAALK